MREVWAQEQLRVYVKHEARQHTMEQTQYMDVVPCCFFSWANVSCTNPKEKLGLEQRSGATDFRSKDYRVSTCSFPTDICFRS